MADKDISSTPPSAFSVSEPSTQVARHGGSPVPRPLEPSSPRPPKPTVSRPSDETFARGKEPPQVVQRSGTIVGGMNDPCAAPAVVTGLEDDAKAETLRAPFIAPVAAPAPIKANAGRLEEPNADDALCGQRQHADPASAQVLAAAVKLEGGPTTAALSAPNEALRSFGGSRLPQTLAPWIVFCLYLGSNARVARKRRNGGLIHYVRLEVSYRSDAGNDCPSGYVNEKFLLSRASASIE